MDKSCLSTSHTGINSASFEDWKSWFHRLYKFTSQTREGNPMHEGGHREPQRILRDAVIISQPVPVTTWSSEKSPVRARERLCHRARRFAPTPDTESPRRPASGYLRWAVERAAHRSLPVGRKPLSIRGLKLEEVGWRMRRQGLLNESRLASLQEWTGLLILPASPLSTAAHRQLGTRDDHLLRSQQLGTCHLRLQTSQ